MRPPVPDDGVLVKGSIGVLAVMTFIIGLYSAPVVEMASRSASGLLSPTPTSARFSGHNRHQSS